MIDTDIAAEKQSGAALKVSAVLATKGRTKEISLLLESLRHQSRAVNEIIVVDQNKDLDLKPLLSEFPDLPIQHLRRTDIKGVNASRNLGWRVSSGDILIFPDDDCTYPPDFVEHGLHLLQYNEADLVSGRAADESGKSINGVFEKTAQWVSSKNVWRTQIEWVLFIRREVLLATNGFDEMIGPGAGTQWGAYEVQDLSLKAQKKGFRQYFDPTLYGYHPKLSLDGEAGLVKLETYAQGMGLILVRHRFGVVRSLYWIGRPFLNGIALRIQRKNRRADMRFAVCRGRLLGYLAARKTIRPYGH